jgi:parvulin-like peptidyl-prolyl isomerase
MRLSVRNNNRLCWATTLAVCVVVIGCTTRAPQQTNLNAAAALPPVVAIVNGHSIPTKLYEMYLKNGSEALEIDPNSDDGRRQLDDLREGIVSELIDRAIIRQLAEQRGLLITADQLAEAERRAIAELGGEQQYDAYLKEHRLSRDEYRETIKSEIYGDMMRKELNSGLSVSDNEIKTYYAAHESDSEFQIPERVTAAHILVAARPNLITQRLQSEKNLSGDTLASALREEMDRLRQRAVELRRKAMTGANFAALARQSSDDPATRERGGDLGTFVRNTHARAFDDAAFALKPGSLSDVVQTEFGFHIIKVSKREPGRRQTLAEATPEIRRRLLAKLESDKLTAWLKDARRKADVRINEPFRFGALKTEFPGRDQRSEVRSQESEVRVGRQIQSRERSDRVALNTLNPREHGNELTTSWVDKCRAGSAATGWR